MKIYIVVTDVLKDVTYSRKSVNTCGHMSKDVIPNPPKKVNTRVVIIIFLTRHYLLEKSDVI